MRETLATERLETRWLGRLTYAEALRLQDEIAAQKQADRSLADELLLLEHDAVYTIGRTPDQSSLRGGGHLSHPLFQINRGGQATYHGPGQLIGYPLIDLKRYQPDLHKYLRWLEELLIEFLTNFGLEGTRRAGLTGVWIGERKIASIGVGVRHWITMHGFALNVEGDLAPFAQITPCGIADVTMTSIAAECGKSVTVAEAAGMMAELARRRVEGLRSAAPAAETL